jgi:predicted secreted protein
MAIRSFGLRVFVDSVPIGGIKEADPPSPEAQPIDVTSQDSGGFKEYIGGMIDGGELGISGFYDFSDAGQLALFEGIGSEKCIHVIFSDGTGAKFTGNILSFGDSVPLDSAVEFKAKIKVAGPVEMDEFTVTGTGALENVASATITVPTGIALGMTTELITIGDRPAFLSGPWSAPDQASANALAQTIKNGIASACSQAGVSATVSANVITLTANDAGSSGNSITISNPTPKSSPPLVLSGSHLLGGSTADPYIITP